MERVLGGFQLPFQRRLTKLYTDTKGSYEFVKEPIQVNEDPDVSALHRKLRMQKDRLVSWGLEWSDPSHSPDIDESLSKAGLGDVVGSVMSTIKDILAEAEPLWNSSRRVPSGRGEKSEKSTDSKISLVTWDPNRFEDLIKDLTGSIDILYDLSRTRQNARQSPLKQSSSMVSFQTKAAKAEEARAFESSRMKTPQQIDPSTIVNPRDLVSARSYPSLTGRFSSGEHAGRQIVYMQRSASSTNPWKTESPPPLSPILLEYCYYDPIYASTGISPDLGRFESLFAGLQTVQGIEGLSDYGTLSLIGYFEDSQNARYGLLYEIPNRFSTWDSRGNQLSAPALVTLRDMLSNTVDEPALEVKYRLCYNIASTVMDLHLKRINHGNLTPENLVFVDRRPKSEELFTSNINLRHPFLTTFDIFPESAQQPLSSDTLGAQQALYRHRLDPRRTPYTALTHESASIDLYSMGILLLEIGIWRSLAETFSGRSLTITDFEPHFKQLAVRCGSLFANIVRDCLQSVDDEVSGASTTEKEARAVYDRVFSGLRRCCAIDDEENTSLAIQPPAQLSPPIQSRSVQLQKIQAEKSIATYVPVDQKRRSITDEKQASIQPRSIPQAKPEQIGIVASKPKFRLFPAIEIDSRHWDVWNRVLMPSINKALRGFYKKYPESVEISLESIGEHANTTKPTILVICSSVGKVRTILKKHFKFDSATYGLMVCRGRVFRSRNNRPRRSAAGDAAGQMQAAENPDYQPRPLNGASIGAYVDGQHLPPVSFGGLVMVGDKQYGLTVHHMLDDAEAQDHLATLPEAKGPFDIPSLDPADYEPQNEDDGYAVSEHGSDYSETSSDGDVYSDDESTNDFPSKEVGDIEGVYQGCGDGYTITQPALDDVAEEFYPDEETVDEDHLDSCRLGEIYASSGIKRRYEDGIAHEIDWALFEFDEAREPPSNYIKGGEEHCRAKERYPVEIAPWSNLHGLEIHCNGRTTGLQKGRILPGMTIVKIFGRQTPSQSYQVSGRLGVPGDSGAWVIDNKEGRACGHVLAWSSRKQVAYICPMEIILADIADTLEAPVSLPPADSNELKSKGHQEQLGVYEQNNEATGDMIANLSPEPPALENTKHLASARYSKGADDELVEKMFGMHVSHGLASHG